MCGVLFILIFAMVSCHEEDDGYSELLTTAEVDETSGMVSDNLRKPSPDDQYRKPENKKRRYMCHPGFWCSANKKRKIVKKRRENRENEAEFY